MLRTDEEFNSRFDEVIGELYDAVQVLRDDDWEFLLKYHNGREQIIKLLDYIDYGKEDDEE